MSYAQVFDTLFRLGLAMLLGYILNKARIINADTNKSLSGMIVNVTSPALAIYAVAGQHEVNAEVVKLLGFGAVMYVLLMLLVYGVVLLIRPARDLQGVYQMLLVFGNVIFMGLPVIQSMYGEQAVFYLNILNLPFPLLIFTYGVWLLRGRNADAGARSLLRVAVSPGFLGGILSVVIYFTRLALPTFVVNALGFIGGLTTPLSMMVVGSMMAAFTFGDLFREKKLYLVALLKLLVMPAAGFAVARLLFQDPMLVGVITASLAMPSATLCAMVGEQHGTGRQPGTIALGVFITTILSMASIPLVILLLA